VDFSSSTVQLHFTINHPNLLAKNEGYRIEYKESFSWANRYKYFKIMASYANRDGGYIIFGVKDRPHEPIGLHDEALQSFSNIDDETWSMQIKECFSPTLKWDKIIYDDDNKSFGIIYTFPAETKPIICKKRVNSNEIRQGAIYFRYKAQSTEIEYTELEAIIEKEKNKINELWLQKIRQLHTAGIDNSAILDLRNGKVSGTTTALYIDETLLNQISFINEGSFVETGGEPALKIIGKVQPVADAPAVVVETERELAINYDLIIRSFLNEDDIRTPSEYIKQICYHTAPSLPVYYYIIKADMSKTDVLHYLDSLPNQTTVLQKLKERIQYDEPKYYIRLPNNDSDIAREKREYYNSLIKENTTVPDDIEKLKYLLLALRSISKEEVIEHKQFLLRLMLDIYETHYNRLKELRAEIRYAICWLDEALYKPVANLE